MITELQTGVDLRGYCTWRIGGTGLEVRFPRSPNAFAELVASYCVQGRSFYVLGRASNILFSSNGVEEPLIYTANILTCAMVSDLPCAKELLGQAIPEQDHLRVVYIEAGTPIASLTSFCVEHSLSGVECLAGIPGSLGGAVSMNAQSFLEALKDDIWLVVVSHGTGNISVAPASSLPLGYRHCGLDGSYVVAAFLRLIPDSQAEIRKRVDERMERRKRTQPIDKPSAGCVFLNPVGHHAGALLDRAGMKGQRIGGAAYSEMHANFILNCGGAASGDVLELMAMGKRAVMDSFGLCIVPEIKFIGKFNDEALAFLRLDTGGGSAAE